MGRVTKDEFPRIQVYGPFIGPVKAFRGNSPDNQNNMNNSDNITKLLVIQSQ